MQLGLQAAQVRKTSFISDGESEGLVPTMYNPEIHHSSTVHAGTFVQQARHVPFDHQCNLATARVAKTELLRCS